MWHNWRPQNMLHTIDITLYYFVTSHYHVQHLSIWHPRNLVPPENTRYKSMSWCLATSLNSFHDYLIFNASIKCVCGWLACTNTMLPWLAIRLTDTKDFSNHKADSDGGECTTQPMSLRPLHNTKLSHNETNEILLYASHRKRFITRTNHHR